MRLVDTHCHVQTSRFDQDRAQVLANAAQSGVEAVVCVGYDADSWRRAQRLVAEAPAGPRLHATAGIHPHDAKDCTPQLLEEVRRLAKAGQIVAIGECGLDFYRNLSTPEQQRDVFVDQIELAKELDLPLVIHDRDAHESVVELLRAHHAGGGVMHCFSGDWDLAKQCLDLGFHISIAGPVTYANASEGVRETARRAPADRLVVETDCPYLTPHPFRGKRNEPAMVKLVLEEVARLRCEDPDQLAEATTANAQRLFRLQAA